MPDRERVSDVSELSLCVALGRLGSHSCNALQIAEWELTYWRDACAWFMLMQCTR